jgi:GT2 family glycosyltransferase
VRAEIAVVDNGSSDGTAAFVAAAYGHVLLLTLAENRGFAAGANAGLACTTGRFVLWLNPDARWIHGSMRDVLAWMDAHPDAGIAGLRLRNPGGSVQRSARTFPSYRSVLGAQHSLLTRVFPSNPFSREYLRGDLSYQEVARVDWVSGACLLHRRDVSQAIGGLDEGFFMYFEDVDFCDRATAAGWSVYFHPGATFEHRIGASSSPVRFRMLIARHRSMWRWYTKHFHRMALKDGAVWCGIWIRCGLMMLGQLWRRV